MADIVLINPRFEISYWGLEHAVPFLGAKAAMPVANLPLLAALTPPGQKQREQWTASSRQAKRNVFA